MSEADQNAYPKMLYRAADEGHAHESAPGADDHIICEHRIVESAEEEEEAKTQGFAESPAEAAETKPAKKKG